MFVVDNHVIVSCSYIDLFDVIVGDSFPIRLGPSVYFVPREYRIDWGICPGMVDNSCLHDH